MAPPNKIRNPIKIKILKNILILLNPPYFFYNFGSELFLIQRLGYKPCVVNTFSKSTKLFNYIQGKQFYGFRKNKEKIILTIIAYYFKNSFFFLCEADKLYNTAVHRYLSALIQGIP